MTCELCGGVIRNAYGVCQRNAVCSSEYSARRYAAAHPAKVKPCAGCGVLMRAEKTDYCWKNCEALSRKDRNLRSNYGITLRDYQRMEAEQHGLCLMCGKPPGGKGKNDKCLHAHHNHASGKVLGLLCRSCNVYWESRWQEAEHILVVLKEMFY